MAAPRAVVLTFALLLAAAAPAAADAVAADTDLPAAALARAALDRFDEAVSLSVADPARARQLYRAAADGFADLIAAGHRNPAVEYNLGNACFRLDQLGRAILHYRRALRLDPDHARAAANLDYARDRVTPFIQPSASDQLTRRLLFWHYATAPGTRFRLLLTASIVGWGLLALRLRWARRELLIGGTVAVLLSIALGTSLIVEQQAQRDRPAAVVVERPQVLHRGRGEGYEAVFAQPLGPGVELQILRVRGDWAEVQLVDGRSGWLPLSSIERI